MSSCRNIFSAFQKNSDDCDSFQLILIPINPSIVQAYRAGWFKFLYKFLCVAIQLAITCQAQQTRSVLEQFACLV